MVILVILSPSREFSPVNTNFVHLLIRLPSQLSEPSDLSSKSLLAIELAGETN